MGLVTTEQAKDLLAELVPLLGNALQQLEQAERQLHSVQAQALVDHCSASARLLKKMYDWLIMLDWPSDQQYIGAALLETTGQLQTTLADFVNAAKQSESTLQQYQALRGLAAAEALLFPLAKSIPAISQIFLEPDVDLATITRLLQQAMRQDDSSLPIRIAKAATGLLQVNNDKDNRGGYSLYVPEYYDDSRPWPLAVVLHGGAGHGRHYLHAWLKVARSRGVLLLAPTSVDLTWSLMKSDIDHHNLLIMLDRITANYKIDTRRILLAGISDGAIYTTYAGLADGNPCTHLAQLSGMFHPINMTNGNMDRTKNKPLYVLHGALDTTFPVQQTRTTCDLLRAGGVDVTYREVPDLGHTSARDEHGAVLDWFGAPVLR